MIDPKCETSIVLKKSFGQRAMGHFCRPKPYIVKLETSVRNLMWTSVDPLRDHPQPSFQVTMDCCVGYMMLCPGDEEFPNPFDWRELCWS